VKRNGTVERALRWHLRPVGAKPKAVIPPQSVVRLVRTYPDSKTDLKIGDEFRIGYYSKQDGTQCVWLVDSTGDYSHTWDQDDLLNYFEVVTRSEETDTYGTHRAATRPL
jgi:hypothetical protein